MQKFPLLILCAGFGKRMLDLTYDKPKPLLKVKNTPILENTINFFQNIGCNEIFINTHYLHKNIETYVLKKYKNYPINLVYEPSILGTGGAIKNIFNYTNNQNICVVNSDILWKPNNRIDILSFIKDFNNVNHCKILLAKENKFFGLKNIKGDFNIKNNIVSNWTSGNDIIFYSGLQIVSKKIFNNMPLNFSINEVWQKLILKKNLKGELIGTNILHIGDKNAFRDL